MGSRRTSSSGSAADFSGEENRSGRARRGGNCSGRRTARPAMVVRSGRAAGSISARHPTRAVIKTGQILDQLRQVGTFDPTALNEVNTNGAPAIGGDGFVPDSLLSIFAFPQTFFHNGSCHLARRGTGERDAQNRGNRRRRRAVEPSGSGRSGQVPALDRRSDASVRTDKSSLTG